MARDQDRRRYAYEERMRIARDVHDVVGHSLSVITMQAGVALHVLDRRPDQVAESLEAIRTTSREALAELRMTLEVFRDPEAGEPRAPVPGLARLDELVGALRQAGRTVKVERVPAADQEPLPAAVDQAAFRIIQEGLTNVFGTPSRRRRPYAWSASGAAGGRGVDEGRRQCAVPETHPRDGRAGTGGGWNGSGHCPARWGCVVRAVLRWAASLRDISVSWPTTRRWSGWVRC